MGGDQRMTKIAIVPNAAGTGTFTIEAPNSNSNRTLVLPDAAGSVVVNETNRIRADFSAALADRTMLQSSVTNGDTLVRAIPNGTGTLATFQVGSSNDPANQSVLGIQCVSGETTSINSFANGTGTVLPLVFAVGASERMRIDTSGRFMVGTTNPLEYGGTECSITAQHFAGVRAALRCVSDSTAGSSQVRFVNPNGEVGNINTLNSSTSYNTSSDYRLKEDVQPMVGASDRLMALKPVNFAWKVDGSRVDGFLAHEAQEVVPECVTGEKDEVDDEGNPVYQGIDQSKIVPLLVAALQEALAEIATLKADVAALKGVSA
jgi:hypothetical protein